MKTKQRSKGLEPFVADILLVIIGITVGAMLLNFSGALTGERLADTGSLLDCTIAELSITDVYISGNEASVIVRNPSRSDVTISNAKLFYKSGPEAVVSSLLPITVPVGSLGSVEFLGAPLCGNFDSVQVFTTCPEVVVTFSGSPNCA